MSEMLRSNAQHDMGETMTKIKICGIKTLKDALAAMEAGADLSGIQFLSQERPRLLKIGICRHHVLLKREHPTHQLGWCVCKFFCGRNQG